MKDVRRRHLSFRFITGDGLVFRSMIHEHPFDIFDPGNGQQIPDKNHQPAHSLQQADCKAALQMQQAYQQGRQQHKQPQRQSHGQHYGHSHCYIHNILMEGLGKPFFKLARFLFIFFPQQLRTAGSDLHAPYQ